MKRMSSMGLTLTAVLVSMLASSALSVTPASAACRHVIPKEVSSWEKGLIFNCGTEVLGESGYTKIRGAGFLVAAGVVCFKVQNATELSGWEDRECKNGKKDKGKYILVKTLWGTKEHLEEQEILPTPTEKEPLTFTSEGKVSKLVSKSGTIECEKLTNEGSFTSAMTGTVTIDLTGCKSKEVKCNTEGDAAGVILAKYNSHLVAVASGEELNLAVALTLEKTLIIKCGVLKVEVKGTVIGQIDGSVSEAKTKSNELLLHESGGKQAIKTCAIDEEFCEEETGTAITYELLANFGKEFNEGVLSAEDKLSLAKEISFDF
jgi:hypothetical protein